MLHTSAIEPGTLSLLKELLSLPVLESYTLAGGTALSLYYGHRLSIDLDLFSNEHLAYDDILNALQQKFGERFTYEGNYSRFGIFCYIDHVKVDIVSYPHPRIAPLQVINGIRMYDSADIAAMKIQAILGRGKKKDFWDIAELLNHYSLNEIIENYYRKYPGQMLLISIPQALIYFADADESEDPVCLRNQTWENVKHTIRQKVRVYLA